jgi:putative transposase
MLPGRFNAFPIQQDEHLLAVLQYVKRNPLRANLVRRAETGRGRACASEFRANPRSSYTPDR